MSVRLLYSIMYCVPDAFFFVAPQSEQHNTNNYAVPLITGNFLGLAPAIIISAACDPLLSDSEAYSSLLSTAGVQVSYKEFAGA